MRKLLLIIQLVIVGTLLNGIVSWGNGTPLYEGNFIYRQLSTKLTNDNVVIVWSELRGEQRHLMMQMVNTAGIPIYNEPLTMISSDNIIIEQDIVTYDDQGILLKYYDEGTNCAYIAQIGCDGNVNWQHEIVNNHNIHYLVDDNLNIYINYIDDVENIDFILSSKINSDGDFCYENELIYSMGFSGNPIIKDISIFNEGISIFFHHHQYDKVIVYNFDGEMTYMSNPFEEYNYSFVRFYNNNFYQLIFNTENNNFIFNSFDAIGNPIVEDAIINEENSNGWNVEKIAIDDNGIYLFKILENDKEMLRIDFDGNFVGTYSIDAEGYNFFEVYDQETDFIELKSFNPDHRVIRLIEEDGLGEDILLQPDEINNYWSDNYYIDNNILAIQYNNLEISEIFTTNSNDNNPIYNSIRDIEYQIIDPKLVMHDGNLRVLWVSYKLGGIAYQDYDQNGNALLEDNGALLIPNITNFELLDNKIFYRHYDYDNYIVDVEIFNLDGESIRTVSTSVSEGYSNDMNVCKFYDKYMIYNGSTNTDFTVSSLDLIVFDENGIQYETTISYAAVQQFGRIDVKGNILFFKDNYDVYAIFLEPDLSSTSNLHLAGNSDMNYLYGGDDKFFLMTRTGTTSTRDFHFFNEGVLQWQTPWTIEIAPYGDLTTIFEDDDFYLIGIEYPNFINIDQYDYEQNLIEENSYNFTIDNTHLYGLELQKQSDKFIFVMNQANGDNENELNFMVTDLTGNIIVPENSETVIDRQNLEYCYDMLFEDDCVYMAVSCGFKPYEGEYERNFYVQKLDFTEYANSDEDEVSLAITNLTCYPNPFNPATTISFDLNNGEELTNLSIYNIKGQLVKTLVNAKLASGNHTITWNCFDNDNRKVGSGVYLYKLDNGHKSLSKKMMLIK